MAKGKNQTFQTLDLYTSAYLVFHGLHPTLQNLNGKVAFCFETTDTLYKLLSDFNADTLIPSASFATAIKMLRGQMLMARGR